MLPTVEEKQAQINPAFHYLITADNATVDKVIEKFNTDIKELSDRIKAMQEVPIEAFIKDFALNTDMDV